MVFLLFVFCALAILSIAIVLRSDTPTRMYSIDDERGIRDYMFQWIDTGRRVAIWTRDMSWVNDDGMKQMLVRKAKSDELIVCHRRGIPASKLLKDNGAKVVTYGEDHSSASIFTIVNYESGGSRVAVGMRKGNQHVIQEYAEGEHPAFYMAKDLVKLVTDQNDAENYRQRIRPVVGKSLSHLRKEWDEIARHRQEQISSGHDLSFAYVLKPLILEMLEGCNLTNVLDLGCGTGELTHELGAASQSVVGVDISSHSIEIAEATCRRSTDTSFYVGTVEEFASHWAGPRFTTAVANMTLMTCLNMDTVIEATAKMIGQGGSLVATITHPWFWPQYRGYSEADWFSYDKEIVIEAPFRISSETIDCVTTHVHRPIASYVNALFNAGFLVDRISEPFPSDKIQALYPEPWEFPRFLAFRARYV